MGRRDRKERKGRGARGRKETRCVEGSGSREGGREDTLEKGSQK